MDVAIEYTQDERAGEHFVRAPATGADWHAPFRQALRGRRRGFQFAFQQADRLARQPGFELRQIYNRGDTLERALERLHAIGLDPRAGRSNRDAMLPEFAGLDDKLFLPIRKTLVDLKQLGAIHIERIELADREPRHPRVRRIVDMRWRAQNSASRRAVCAALAQLEHEGIDLLAVRIGDRALGQQMPVHVVGWTLERLTLLPHWIRKGQGQWLHVVNPSRSKPLLALRFTEPVAEALPGEGSYLLD